MTLLRAMDPAYSTDAAIIREFYPSETLKLKSPSSARARRRSRKGILPMIADDDVIDPETGEVYPQ